MSDANILDEEPAPLPGKRKSDAHEESPSCKTLKTKPLSTDDGENHVNGRDGDDPERQEDNGDGKVESLPENGEEEQEEEAEDGRGSVEDEDGEDEDGEDEDDEDYDEKEREEGDEEVVDRKGKGIMGEGEGDEKGKGKSVISWDDYEFDSDISLDCEDDDSDSDDSDTDGTEELLEMGSDGYLSDDPLAEVDMENILPSRTRHGTAGTKGIVFRRVDRKDVGDGDVDRNGDGSADHTGDGNANRTGDAAADRTGDGDNKGL